MISKNPSDKEQNCFPIQIHNDIKEMAKTLLGSENMKVYYIRMNNLEII